MLELLAWKKTDWDFIKWRRVAFLFSGAMVLMGLFATVQIFRGKAEMGVELAGGTMLQITFQKPIDIAELRQALEKKGWQDMILQKLEDTGNKVLVKVPNTQATGGGAVKLRS